MSARLPLRGKMICFNPGSLSGVLQMVQLQHIPYFRNIFKSSTIGQKFFTEISLQMVSAQRFSYEGRHN